MPLFDIRGAQRALPVAPTLPDDASFAAAARAVVSEHLSTLLGEQVVTVAEKPRSTADLLALDAAGHPVVVQIMAKLTGPGLLEALDVAGMASRLTRRDLAAKHPEGPDRFHATLREFFASVPGARNEAPSPGSVRLVIVCADVDAALLPTLDFLRSGATRIELLHVGMVAGRRGQRLIDVSPLADQTAARRAVECALTGAVPVVPAAEVPGQVQTVFGMTAPPVPPVPPVPPAPPVPPVPPAPTAEAPTTAEAATTAEDADTVAYVPVFLDLPPGLPTLPGRPAALPTADEVLSPILNLLAPPRDPDAVVGPVDAELAALARDLDAPMPLVWLRHRRGERFEVVLHPDGSLHTEDGVRYADPTWAASAVSGGTASDGWRVWRDGDYGRTLAELRV